MLCSFPTRGSAVFRHARYQLIRGTEHPFSSAEGMHFQTYCCFPVNQHMRKRARRGAYGQYYFIYFKNQYNEKIYFMAGCYCPAIFKLCPRIFRQKILFPTIRLFSPMDGRPAMTARLRHFNTIIRGHWTLSGHPPGLRLCLHVQRIGMVNHAHYDKRGNWICTVSGYQAEKLQQETRRRYRVLPRLPDHLREPDKLQGCDTGLFYQYRKLV